MPGDGSVRILMDMQILMTLKSLQHQEMPEL